jgi:hypothetical protein
MRASFFPASFALRQFFPVASRTQRKGALLQPVARQARQRQACKLLDSTLTASLHFWTRSSFTVNGVECTIIQSESGLVTLG